MPQKDQIKLEPLQSLLSLYKQKDKVLKNYLPETTRTEILYHTYHGDDDNDNDDMLYLNDNAIFVSKSSGLIIGKGKILKIQGPRITVKDNRDNLCLDLNEHYVFIKRTKTTNTEKRDMFRAILQKLGD